MAGWNDDYPRKALGISMRLPCRLRPLLLTHRDRALILRATTAEGLHPVCDFSDNPSKCARPAGRARPASFRWQDRWYRVEEIRRQWFDTGHGATPLRMRNWRTRRHRKHFLVRTEEGLVFHLYYDYANRAKPAWVLAKSLAEEPAESQEKRGRE